jgi:mRNA interferase MazF
MSPTKKQGPVVPDPGDVVVVPFPFSERRGQRRRPALVISKRAFNHAGHTVMAMITSSARSSWPGDVELDDLEGAGLRVPCRVRLKVFTLDNRLIVRCAGSLSRADAEAVSSSLRKHLGVAGPDQRK